MSEKVFFEWKEKTNELVKERIEEDTTISPSENEKITPLEYVMNTVIQLLNKEDE